MYRYEAVTAKTKCLAGKLLGEEELLHLAALKDVGEIAAFLREKTAYGETMKDINVKQVNRRKLEYYIKKTLLADYLKMRRFTHGEERKYIAFLLARYEIEYMLNVWRRCANAEAVRRNAAVLDDEEFNSADGLLELYTIYGQKSKIDLAGLKDAESVRDFMNAVSGTEYYEVFTGADAGADIESRIYEGYYKKLIAAADAFGEEGESLKIVFTASADLKNLERIYRMRYNFNMTPEETAKRLIPLKYKLNRKDIGELLNIGDPKKFLIRCNATYYGRKVDFTAGMSVTMCGSLYLYKLYKSSALKNSGSFDVVVKYFYIKEVEIENLVFIIEGVRYGMHPDEIKANLIM